MAQRLFFVSLVDRTGNCMAGGHYLARDAAHARAIGQADLCKEPSPDLPPAMAASIKAKLAGWYAVKARPSSASLANALNASVSA